ncbi:transcriptional activator DEMETER-like protein [Cinnamomum micranthum f. kanehirae]|uniref:Transcriptional activator DEMETER-like protein n=1 Tax=Cinnamomum micranthum f. kanehirae TaxID=337451 RepID=A0A3S3QAF3_9MAGN|nr:transcriptional activator DEMETER-like protein [Cinnamomum micranthum f. kanehirae]
MEFGRGIPPPKENNFQMQGPWIPATPSKPEQTNRALQRPLWLNTGAYSNGVAQQNACQNATVASNSTPAAGMQQLNPSAFADRGADLARWKAAMAAQTQVSGLDPYMEALKNAAARLRGTTPYAHNLMGITDSTPAMTMQTANNAASLRPPISNMENDNGGSRGGNRHQQSNPAANLLCRNQALLLQGSTPSSNNINCYPTQMPHYGFPVPYHTTNNHSSPAKTMADAVKYGTISFQPTPMTPDQGKRVQSSQMVEPVGLTASGRLIQGNENVDSFPPSVNVDSLAQGPVNPLGNQGQLELNYALSPVLPSTPNKELHDSSSREGLGENLLAATLSTPVEENHNPNEGNDHGIDLNKTPQQKPKRKKHRPKVIREVKPKRTPKPVTPNQANNKENPSGKRKYVRRAATKTSVNPNAQETVNSQGGTSIGSCKRHLDFNSESREDGHLGTGQVPQYAPNSSTGDNSAMSSSSRALNSEAQAQYYHQCAGINNSRGSKSTSQISQGLKVVEGNSSVGVAFDLNHSITQSQVSCNPLPGNANPCQTIVRGNPSIEHMNALATKNMGSAGSCINIGHMDYAHMHHAVQANEIDSRINPAGAAHGNHPSRDPSRFQTGLINYNQCNANSRSHVLLEESNHTKRGSKRLYNFVVDETHPSPANLYGTHGISIETHQRIIQQNENYGKGGAQGIHVPNITKKMRTDMMNNEIVTNQLALQNSDRRPFPFCNQVEGTKKSQNGACYISCDMNSQSRTGTDNQQVPDISRKVFSHLNAQRGINLNEPQAPMSRIGLGSTAKGRFDRTSQINELASFTPAAVEFGHPPVASVRTAVTYNDRQPSNTFCRTQARIVTQGADGYLKIKTKENAKELVHLVHPISSTTNRVYLQEHKAPVNAHHKSCMESTTPAKKPSGPATSSSRHSQLRNSQNVPISYIHNWQSSSSIQHMLGAGSPFQMSAPWTDPVDEIVRRLGSLNINSSSEITTAQPEGALVAYDGDKKMIPYEGPFDPTKKRHPRPKVDLDPETDRVWKLLMWKEDNDGKEGIDAEKEKWWEEERRVFRGRADSFIARMHLVQGDRRFTPWKGSVVDSVVGVFLTQNVSDQLSSSAFMALAARFPLQQRSTTHNEEGKSTSAEEQDVSILGSDDFTKQQSNVSSQKVYDRGSIRIQEVEPLEEKEMASSNESFSSNMGACTTDCTKSEHIAAFQIGSEICQESSENRAEMTFTMTGSACLMGVEDGKGMESVVSSQVSVISSQNSTESTVAADTIGSSSESNSEAENLINRFEGNDFYGSTSFLDLLQMERIDMLREFYVNGNESIPSNENFDVAPNQLKDTEYVKSCKGVECLNGVSPSNSTNSTHHPQGRQEFKGILGNCSSNCHLHIGPGSGLELGSAVASGEENRSYLPSTAEITELRDNRYTMERRNVATENLVECDDQRKQFTNSQTALKGDSCVPPIKHPVHPSSTSTAKPYTHLDAAESSSLVDKQTYNVGNIAEPSLADEVYSSKSVPRITTKNDLKERRGTSRADKMRAFDWDSLRKQACPDGPKKERSSDTMDSADWEAVRCADVNEIAKAIRERGMSNMLSGRIKDFLNRLVREHGSIDLEWLRDVPPDKTKDYLLSIRGLGLKSVECVRLLTLHHLAFPVDTNVGRICVRLGWVPLQPLPESLQLHLLELYPLLETIQKYLWPRLCTLDQRTLYELHYQMITFGKVFCTKSKPNCNACPMRGECKHFASAFASARLALPGPEEKRIVSSGVPTTIQQEHNLKFNLMSLPPPEQSSHSQAGSRIIQCEPIIEEPATPEPESIETLESSIEDAFWTEDPDEIPTITLNIKEFTQNIQNFMQEKGELQDSDMSKALVALTQEAASIPMPKLKNVSRLRTEHQVYELPDSHPLIAELDRREHDDPCPYLLAIWTPGETAQSIQPPEMGCTSEKSGKLCDKNTCFTCNSIREASAQTVRGTLLIPCRTAMRGSFPLNGTYFQVNEVFADHDSSMKPIDVPRAWIWNLPRRTVYFGTSVSTIFKGLTTEGIQQCFWRGFVCVRGFDQKTRAPRPLMARLHFPASKLVGAKRAQAGSV